MECSTIPLKRSKEFAVVVDECNMFILVCCCRTYHILFKHLANFLHYFKLKPTSMWMLQMDRSLVKILRENQSIKLIAVMPTVKTTVVLFIEMPQIDHQ